MSNTLRITLIISIIIYFYAVIHLLKKRRLSLKYSLLWLFMGITMAVLLTFPNLLRTLCSAIGIETGMNGLFTCAIGFILMLLMALTAITSRQSDRIKNLVQENALLEKRIQQLEMSQNIEVKKNI